ncbi:hypothetical protein BJ912DRAFT_177731 [Pholiota molesta]|nr:hypothetical protein BJ912DRAFT_177731 [Pholiota molesta]
MEWIQAPAAMRKLILWMYGPAGSGKTAIAQSIAEECMKRGLLAASFFFGRTAPGRDDTTRVITTIAYQISQFLPQIENHLFTAIERDQTIFDRTLATQMQVLVIEPLNSILAALAGPIFIVLDGLDESGPNARAQTDLLNVIGTAIHALQHIPLIFLIASRPEHELREAFKGTLLHSLMRPLELNNRYNPDTDIELYFTSMFRRIYDKHLREDIHLPSPWPSKDDVHRLVSTASGQFIFAATVVKFIDSIRHHPAERLKIIFGLSTPGNETPFTLLDALYYRILSSVAEPAKVLQILTMHVLRLRDANVILGSTIETIEALLGLNVRRVLVDMHALVFVPPPGKDYVLGAELQLHHASFHDFLMDRSRCHEFFIDVSQAHIDLTWRWWEVISNYQFPSELALFDCLHNFVHHCSKSPAGILAENLARFDLKELLRKHYASWDLLSSPWNAFFECVDQQAGDRDDISLRMRTEFDTFFLDCLSKYPAALQTYFPTILAHSMSGGKADITRLYTFKASQQPTICQ